MKKLYTKPQIVFEDFSLSTNIADCSIKVNSSYSTCVYDDGRTDPVFSESTAGCVTSGNGIVCYDNPTESSRVFNS